MPNVPKKSAKMKLYICGKTDLSPFYLGAKGYS